MIVDILLYRNKNKVTGIPLIIDFEKAFDIWNGGFSRNVCKHSTLMKDLFHMLMYFTATSPPLFSIMGIFHAGFTQKKESGKGVRCRHIYSFWQ